MLLKIILLLTLTPLIELLILLRIAHHTSILFTVLLVIGTGIAGGILAKIEGLRVLSQIQHELNSGRLPGDSLIDGAMVLVAGALLLTPGIITDVLGFALLLPHSRHALRNLLKRKFKTMAESGQVHIYREMGFGPISNSPPPGSPPLENEGDNGRFREEE